MKKLLVAIIIGSVILVAGTALAANGWSGYNYKARIFVGTTTQWCEQKPGLSVNWCLANGYAPYMNDKITMKWNAEWDRGNKDNWSKPPYDAWENNEWNGAFPGGSGEVWHYKIKWIGPCGAEYDPLPDGGYCFWGQFEVLMDQGVADGVHSWFTHAIPTGYGNN